MGGGVGAGMKIEQIKDLITDLVPVGEVYKDVAQKPLREASKSLVDVVKTLRLVLFPFQYGAAYQGKFATHLKRVYEQVPQGRQVAPPPQIVGPVLEGLRYVPDTDLLARLFENLLARAIDKERMGEAHPAFVGIIGQLSPDEAHMLYHLKDCAFKVTEKLAPRVGDIGIETAPDEIRVVPSYPKEALAYPQNFDMYWKHLRSLNLLALHDCGIVDVVEPTPDGVDHFTASVGLCQLSEFGELFVKACVPDSLEGTDKE